MKSIGILMMSLLLLSSVNAYSINMDGVRDSAKTSDITDIQPLSAENNEPTTNSAKVHKITPIEVSKRSGGGCITSSWSWNGVEWVPTPVFNRLETKTLNVCVPFDMNTRSKIAKPQHTPSDSEAMSYDVKPIKLSWWVELKGAHLNAEKSRNIINN